jgi:hypothetical protein
MFLLENPLHHAGADAEPPAILSIPSPLAFSSSIRDFHHLAGHCWSGVGE